MSGTEGNRYEITGILGKGGFGTVYRARLRGTQGFAKDVAIKLLSDRNPDPGVLERFRDEARILGLVRDRAVIQVAPPIQLGERWAVVMEYVDGTSLRRIVREKGPIPPMVVAEIVGEIARALHRLWTQSGPDGEPLHLRHRDIKPSNIQVTPAGTVKLLDFGIAKADFDAREAHTTSQLHGTDGYVAPERYYGHEGETTDVFSLGVVMHVLLTATRPRGKPRNPFGAHTPEGATMELALRMCALDPEERPKPREVEQSCADLVQRFSGEERLSAWSERVVPAVAMLENDDLVGEVLTATIATRPVVVSSTGAVLAGGGALVGASGLVALAVAAALVLAVLVWAMQQDTATPPEFLGPEISAPERPDPEPAPVAPEPSAKPDPAPQPTQEPVPTPSPVADPASVAQPAVEPTAPPEPAVPTFPVTFVSLPPDAEVWLDGVRVGTTPLAGHPVRQGTRRLRIVLGESSIDREIPVGRRSPNRYLWRVGSDQLETSR